MQFVCNNCKAKYEIPADRIKGRILKIRCRECGNVIEIRGDALIPRSEAAAPKAEKKPGGKQPAKSPSSSLLQSRFKESFTSVRPLSLSSTKPAKAPAPKPPTRADKLLELAHKAEVRAMEMKEVDRWYVAIKSSPVGPVNKTKIRAYIRRGDLSQASLVWREGFNDWKPLRTVPELNEIYTAIKDEIQKPEQIDIAARLRRAATQGTGPGVVEAQAAAPAAPRKKYAPQPGRDEPIELEPVEVSMTQPPPPAAAQNAETESVIDEALKGYYVGRIDSPGSLPGMDAVRPSYAAEYMPLGGIPMEAEESLSHRLMHSRLFLLIGGAVALLAGFGIMITVMHFTESKSKKTGANYIVAQKEEKKQTAEETGSVEEVQQGGDILAGLIITVEEAMEAEAASDQENPGGETGDPSKKKSHKKDTSYKTTVMQMPNVDEVSVSQSTIKKKVEAESSSGDKGKNGLADDEIRSAVTKNSKTIQRCYEKVLGKGMGVNEKIRVKVQVKVGTSGKVTKVKVIEISKYGNFLTPCIENGIQTWVFPKADAPSEFIFPVLLTPKT